MNSRRYNRSIIVASVAGVLLSTYALYVEMSAEAKPTYKAFCDIGEHASCSRVLTSKYSKGFGFLSKNSPLSSVPNCIYGTLYYCLMIILSTYDTPMIVGTQVVLAFTSVISSIYLAYLLVFVLKDLCLVCVSTYIVNGALIFNTYKKFRMINKKNN